MAKYIVIRNSTEQAAWLQNTTQETGHMFRVMEGGFQPVLNKAQSMDTAVDGTLDLSAGSVRYEARYNCWVVENDAEGYGSLSDLWSYFLLNNPNGSPTNLITLVDHYGTAMDGYFVGQLPPQPLTTTLVGAGAIYVVPIDFMAKASLA